MPLTLKKKSSLNNNTRTSSNALLQHSSQQSQQNKKKMFPGLLSSTDNQTPVLKQQQNLNQRESQDTSMINMLTTPQTQTIDENDINKYSQLDSSPREVLNMTKQSQSSGNGLTKYINPINRSSEGDMSSVDMSKRSVKVKKFENRMQKSPMERSGSVKQ